jgi:hypothetical protein
MSIRDLERRIAMCDEMIAMFESDAWREHDLAPELSRPFVEVKARLAAQLREEEFGPAFSFPNRARCPRCRSLRTKATSTPGAVQHRRCGRCGKTFQQAGTPV